MNENMSGNYPRTDEELAWEEEFKSGSNGGLGGTVRGAVRFATRLPIALVEVPLEFVPSETRRHAKAAVRETFLAVRSLFGAMADTVEGVLSDPNAVTVTTVQGPPGTWGTARSSASSTTSSTKVKRIQVTEEEELEGKVPTDAPGDMP